MIDTQLLNSALSTIHEDESGRPFQSGQFDKLLVDLHVHFINEEDKYKTIFFLFEHIHRDVWNLETIIQRLAWQKELILIGSLSDEVGAQFAACDIDLFHVQYRSLFDRVAKIIGLLSGKPNTLPKSFRKLREWFTKPGNAQRIDGQLAQFVAACTWFFEMREVRDSIVHREARTLVYPMENRILFQVQENFRRKVHIPEIMFNENVVDFELYSGLMVGYLFDYLEKLSVMTRQKLNLRESKVEPRNYHGGLRFIRVWIQQLCALRIAI
jgi:hypothetical protein